MAVKFCSIADVISVSTVLGPDYDRDELDDNRINAAIDECSDKIRLMLAPRFNRTVVEADFPNIPPAIKHLCKIEAAILLEERGLLQVGASRSANLQAEAVFWKRQIVSGNLIRDDGSNVPTLTAPSVTMQAASSEVEALYENGNRKIR